MRLDTVPKRRGVRRHSTPIRPLGRRVPVHVLRRLERRQLRRSAALPGLALSEQRDLRGHRRAACQPPVRLRRDGRLERGELRSGAGVQFFAVPEWRQLQQLAQHLDRAG